MDTYESAVGKPGRLEAYSPIFFPLILIFLKTGFEHPHPVLAFLGNPNIALLIGVILFFFRQKAWNYRTKELWLKKL